MKEPIAYYFEKFGFNKDEVKEFITGEKYSLVLLDNGNIGVCANLLQHIVPDINDPKIDRMDDRIFLNAYFNAKLNYLSKDFSHGDIFDMVNFKNYKSIVMIGYFKPVFKKFMKDNIKITIFDFMQNDEFTTDIGRRDEFLNGADALILSSTTVFNGTFMEIIEKTNNCHIFLLGPSTIFDKEMFEYKNIKGLFGGRFVPNDKEVKDIIANNGGTKKFLPFMEKVTIFKNI